MSKHPYDLKKPCKNCPFRNDRELYLRPERYEEIRWAGGEFHCHETVDYENESGEGAITDNAKVCAGFLILHEKSETPNQMMRIAERIGMYDRRELDMGAPVFGSWDELMDAAEELEEMKNG